MSKTETSSESSSPESGDDDLPDGVYEVDKILDAYVIDGKMMYEVLWKLGDTTSEPIENLTGSEPLVEAFHARMKAEKEEKKKKRSKMTKRDHTSGYQTPNSSPPYSSVFLTPSTSGTLVATSPSGRPLRNCPSIYSRENFNWRGEETRYGLDIVAPKKVYAVQEMEGVLQVLVEL